MRKTIVMLALLLVSGMLLGQSNELAISQGDIVMLGKPSASNYQYIDFPRKNIIIKRGAIADFKSLVGKTLVVKSIETDKDGETVATLTRKDGLNFFRFFPEVKSNISRAIASNELKTVPYKG